MSNFEFSNDNKIVYVVPFDIPEYAQENRSYSQSGANKARYIMKALANAGYSVEILSCAWTSNKSGFFSSRKQEVFRNVVLRICPTFGANTKVTKYARAAFSLLWLLVQMLRITKNQRVIVYHALISDQIVLIAKAIKRFTLILEFEEMYGAVEKRKDYFYSREYRIIRNADRFIFCNDLVSSILNNTKPFVVLYGDYTPILSQRSRQSEKINLLYAGIIDSIKAGAFIALEACEYLESNYILNIIGFGKPNDIKQLEKKIQEHNLKYKCKAYFNGEKKGKDYIDYISRMDIGLSTQTSKGEYLKYSFPSKLLSYLGVGLRCVTSDIECVRQSEISDLMKFYLDNDAHSLAIAIQNIDLSSSFESKDRLIELDKRFVNELVKLCA